MVALPSAAILAGGQARRFGGRDKGRLVIEGRSIIVRQMEVLQQVAHDTFIVGPRAGLYADLGLRVYADLLPGCGALGGLHTALEVARGDLVLTVACDLPFLDAGLMARLVARAAGHDGAWVTSARGPEPLVACYQRSCRHRVLERLRAGTLKAADLGSTLDMARVGAEELAEFGAIDRLLANVNTPEDFARIESSR
jgi:molybdopterin-guanine dinucleotide biosynthesis protein A